MNSVRNILSNGQSLLIREAGPDDATMLVSYANEISAESDYLTFGPGEFCMSVRKPCWDLGIGGLLVENLISWAQSGQVVNKINLRVRTDNQRAIELYKRKGFELEGTLRREIKIRGKYFDHYLMGLVL